MCKSQLGDAATVMQDLALVGWSSPAISPLDVAKKTKLNKKAEVFCLAVFALKFPVSL